MRSSPPIWLSRASAQLALTRPVQVAAVRAETRRLWSSGIPVRILDLGCGTKSPLNFVRYISPCEYLGIDWKIPPHLEGIDESAPCRLLAADLSEPGILGRVTNGKYDAIVLSHVLEHVENYLGLLADAIQVLARDGVIYVEYPSPRSLRLPSRCGTLNFFDDPTHISPPDTLSVVNLLREHGFRIRYASTRHSPKWLLMSPIRVGVAVLWRQPISGPVLWDLVGFATQILAVRSGVRVKHDDSTRINEGRH